MSTQLSSLQHQGKILVIWRFNAQQILLAGDLAGCPSVAKANCQSHVAEGEEDDPLALSQSQVTVVFRSLTLRETASCSSSVPRT